MVQKASKKDSQEPSSTTTPNHPSNNPSNLPASCKGGYVLWQIFTPADLPRVKAFLDQVGLSSHLHHASINYHLTSTVIFQPQSIKPPSRPSPTHLNYHKTTTRHQTKAPTSTTTTTKLFKALPPAGRRFDERSPKE